MKLLKDLISWKLRMYGKFLESTSGWKTYTAAGLMGLYAILGLIFGFHEADDAAKAIMAGLALIGIGHKLDRAIK